MKRKILAMLLSAAMVTGLFTQPGTAMAQSGRKDICGDNVTAMSKEQPSSETEEEKRDDILKQQWEEEREAAKLWTKQQSRRKKAGTAVEKTMSELLKEDGSFESVAEGSKITISTAEELRLLSEYTQAGNNTAGVSFIQTTDLDCQAVTMSAIGGYFPKYLEEGQVADEDDDWRVDEEGNYYYLAPVYFSGTYDGGGYSIKNLRLLASLSHSNSWYQRYVVGLFGLMTNATVQNVVIEDFDYFDNEGNVFVEETAENDESDGYDDDFSRYIYIGAIATYSYGDTVIKNCVNRADITSQVSNTFMAGIACEMEGKEISGCINEGNLELTKENGWVSGIVGWSFQEVRDCENRGNIHAANGTATGIANEPEDSLLNCKNSGNVVGYRAAGIAQAAYADVENCTNTGNIEGTKRNAAGIVGSMYSVLEKLQNCVNEGDVTSNNYAGGIVGTLVGNIYHSVNKGKVSGKAGAGGLAGDSYGTIFDSTNEGEICSDNYAGGIVGYAYEGNICMVQNTGYVHGDFCVGGIAGASCQTCFSNMINKGNVSSEDYAGGVFGSITECKVVNAWNLGEVNGKLAAGGMVGSNAQDVITKCQEDYLDETPKNLFKMANTFGNCVNLGKVISEKYSGGLIGYSDIKTQMITCYYDSDMAPTVANGETISAETVTGKEAQSQEFLDRLNQNITQQGFGLALDMFYDEEGNIQWQSGLLLKVNWVSYYSSQIYDDENLNACIKMQLVSDSTGETSVMTQGFGGFGGRVKLGESYSIYMIQEDGTRSCVQKNVVVSREENVCALSMGLLVFRAYTEVHYQEEEEGYSFGYGKPYSMTLYTDVSELSLPAEPAKEGYTFMGWYSIPEVCCEESYFALKEKTLEEYDQYVENLEATYVEDDEFYSEYLGIDTFEEFKEYYLTMRYGEEFSERDALDNNFDSYVDQKYKVTELVTEVEDEEEGETWFRLATDTLYAKWTANAPETPAPTVTPTQIPKEIPTQNPSPAPDVQQTSVPEATVPQTLGDYVQRDGVIYRLNREKKTAAVTGVTTKTVKKLTVKKQINQGDITYPVTEVEKKAFANCKSLKKITVQGNNLKKVHKKALQGAYKKVKIVASKKIRKLFPASATK